MKRDDGMRYKIIANPVAGRGFGAKALPTIKQLLSEHGLDFDLVATTWAGEAVELARQAVLGLLLECVNFAKAGLHRGHALNVA